MSTLAVGTADPLSADVGGFESAKLFDVVERLEDRIDNGIDLLFVAQEQVVREPNGLMVCGALRGWAPVHVPQVERLLPTPAQRRIIRGIRREQRTPVNRLIEEPVAGNAFLLQRGHERRARNVLHLL